MVVTGGHGGLGRAVVEHFQHLGADVRAPARDELDTADDAAVSAYYAGLPRLWASVHLVGGYQSASLLDTEVRDVRAQWELNFLTAFLCTREAVRRMQKDRQGGRIVNIASRPALTAAVGVTAYASAKAALISLTQVAALETKDHGILVNAVAPSVIDTPQNRAAMPGADFAKWPKPEDLARTIAFLSSPDNTLTTGAVVPAFGAA
jgi:NAD(P)-dependent dehydrogenase (short-subunit alcohol dehydrogenase family)